MGDLGPTTPVEAGQAALFDYLAGGRQPAAPLRADDLPGLDETLATIERLVEGQQNAPA